MDKRTEEAARITFAYLVVYFGYICIQVALKLTAMWKHRSEKSKAGPNAKPNEFNRYDNPITLVGDRIVGNSLEWMGLFLGLLWLLVIVGERSRAVISYGWIYVAMRAIYPFLALAKGITKEGAQPIIFMSTVPAYAVLFYFGFHVYSALYTH